jgi:hypothetical protein
MTKATVMSDAPNYIYLDMLRCYEKCRREYTDDFMTLARLDNYTASQRFQVIAEVGHYHMTSKLPSWASIIERVEPDGNGGNIFVHRDTKRDN